MHAPTASLQGVGHSLRRATDDVFRTQLLLTGAVILTICFGVGFNSSHQRDSAAYFVGLTGVLWISIAAAVIPWSKIAHRWQMLIPLLDIAAIATLRYAEPDSGFGYLMIFPVMWLSTVFGARGALAGTLLATGIMWGQIGLSELGVPWLPASGNPSATTSITVVLAFVAVVTRTTSRRVESQRVLLRRQTAMLEKSLQRSRISEQTIREALDAVDFAVITLDLNGTILTSNRATRALLTRLDLPTSTPWHRFPLYHADKITPVAPTEIPDVRAQHDGAVEGVTLWLGHATGKRIAVDVGARLLHDQHGEVDRVVVVIRDITVEMRAITDRDDLVTSMSHELRTPLSSVLGYIDLVLESEDIPDSAREMLTIALAGTERVNSLVSELLAARSTNPEIAISLRPTTCDVNTLVTESIDAVRILAADRLIPISLQSEPEVQACIDAFRIRQVLDNLLSNAIKYNKVGGRITVSVRILDRGTPDAHVQISVADTGRGMTPDEQQGLFERFYRAESVRGSTVHGTGLGLSISRDIVHRHDGSINVVSEPGVGTEVIVSLPVSGPSPATSTPAPTVQEDEPDGF
jgi:two-component system phosphate regulon sensor histidine kinase PhoR